MRRISWSRLFESSSSPGKTYEVLGYPDGTMTCNCKGWTRRVAPDGSRTCRHVAECQRQRTSGAVPVVRRQPVVHLAATGRRVFDL